jgi:hypothetical protein
LNVIELAAVAPATGTGRLGSGALTLSVTTGPIGNSGPIQR